MADTHDQLSDSVKSRKSLFILLGVLIIAAVIGAIAYHLLGSGVSKGNAVEVDWRLFGEMDYVTGKASPELKALDGQYIRAPGFMVPLEDNQRAVSEFLLVPTPQACIHVPPPPPNQMIFSHAVKGGAGFEVSFGPIWVYGTLKITDKKHMYGVASFELIVDRIEPYQ